MAKKFAGLKSLPDKLLKIAKEAITDQKLADRLKNKILLEIKKNSTLPSGTTVNQISNEWQERREKLAVINKTSPYYGQNKSNMTFTGQFLNSFKAQIFLFGRAVQFVMSPIGMHKGYKLIKGGKSKSVPNAEIGKGFIERGDDYTEISNEVKDEMTKSIKARILKEFKLRL
jgi:hypothetical protein